MKQFESQLTFTTAKRPPWVLFAQEVLFAQPRSFVCAATHMRTPSRHGRTRAPQPRRRSRAQLSARRAAVPPRRVSRKTAAFGLQSCGTEGTRLLIQDLAAAARQVSAARRMRAGVLSSDRAPSPGWDRDARRKVPSCTDRERSVASRSPCDRAARRRTCADARVSVRSPAPLQACHLPFVADELSTEGPPSHVSLRRWALRLSLATDADEPICSENKADA